MKISVELHFFFYWWCYMHLWCRFCVIPQPPWLNSYHFNFSSSSDCRVIGYFGQLFITVHIKIIENDFLNMDVYHKINPSILSSQSSDWLLITSITKGSFPPSSGYFPTRILVTFVCTDIPKTSWNNDPVKVRNYLGLEQESPTEKRKFTPMPPRDWMGPKLKKTYSDACMYRYM